MMRRLLYIFITLLVIPICPALAGDALPVIPIQPQISTVQEGAPLTITTPTSPTPEQVRKAKDMLQQQAVPKGELQNPAAPEQPVPPEVKSPPPPEKKLSTFEAYIQGKSPLTISTDIRPFGYSLFEQPPGTFAPVNIIPVGPNYLLGPGDEIKISVWGKASAEYSPVIDRDGKINIPQVGILYLSGLTFSEARTFLKKEFGRYYKPSEVKMNVSMGRLRSLRVFVVGKVRKPGSYTLSSLSTLINALFAAGGPNDIGTMRDIQIKRDGRTIAHFDIYDFILEGDKTKDMRLMPEDVVFIPTVGPLVGIAGDVISPAIYELKGETRINDLIKMAGGVRATGYLQKIQIERIVDNQAKVVLDINLKELTKDENIPLKDGDVVKVFSIISTVTNPINLRGNLLRPGTYEWRKGMRVRDVIKSTDDLLPDTFMDFALIERLVPPDYHKEYLSIAIGKLLIEGDENENIPLMPYDTFVVFNKWNLIDKENVHVTGAVNRPGEYEYRPNMKLSDLLKLAGGLKRYAYIERAELIRVDLTQEEPRYRKIDIELKKAIEGDLRHDIALQENDYLTVKAIPEYALKKEVELSGNIRTAGSYPWFEGMRLTDLIKPERKGEVFLPDTFFDYALIERMVPPDYHKEYVAIYPGKVYLKGDMTADIELKPFDVVTILNKWDLIDKENVRITGAVNRPGEYEYRPNMRLSDLLKLAGGLKRPEHPDSYLPEGMIIRRMLPDFREERISFDFKKAVIENNKEADILLQAMDEVRIFDSWELAQNKKVNIIGAVNKPGILPWTYNMRVSDLLKLAGGTKYFASMDKAELTRVAPTPEGPKTERFNINLKKAIEGDPKHDILLKEDDYLFVRTVPEWELYRAITISGEVKFAGAYTIKKGETLSSLIERAGGYTDNAYLRGATFTRNSVKELQQKGIDKMVERLEREILIAGSTKVSTALSQEKIEAKKFEIEQRQKVIKSLKNLKAKGRMVIRLAHLRLLKGSEYDIELEDGDTLFIPMKNSVINVLGAVMSQNSFIYSDRLDYKEYIKMAGGFSKFADTDNLFVIKVDGSARKLSRGFFNWNVSKSRWEVSAFGEKIKDIEPGDTIVVPEKMERIAWLREIKDITAVLMQIAVTTGVVLNLF